MRYYRKVRKIEPEQPVKRSGFTHYCHKVSNIEPELPEKGSDLRTMPLLQQPLLNILTVIIVFLL